MNSTQHGTMPGVVAPEQKRQRTLSATSVLTFKTGKPDPAPGQKQLAALIARLTLACHVVHQCQSGDYLVSKYGMTRHCADYAELAAFAQKLGVK